MLQQRLILVVVCCVLCVVVVVVVVTSPFSYLTGRNARSASQNGRFIALITKDASLDAPNVGGCSKSSLSLDFEHVLTFRLKRDIGAL